MINLKIYVPTPGSWLARTVRKGSGIVGGDPYPAGHSFENRVTVDYEGNVNGASNIVTWEDKVFHAAGRHVTKYPTIARATLDRKDLIEVGTFQCEDNWKHAVYTITNQTALTKWTD